MKFTYGGSTYTDNYSRMFLGICQCPCHESKRKKKLHDDSCCKPCEKCGKGVVLGRIKEHDQKCKGF